MKWYTTSKVERDSKGIIAVEMTGKIIAVSYDVKDAQLIAAAPDLLSALELLLRATEDGNHITGGVIDQAQAAVRNARGL